MKDFYIQLYRRKFINKYSVCSFNQEFPSLLVRDFFMTHFHFTFFFYFQTFFTRVFFQNLVKFYNDKKFVLILYA